MCAKMSPVNGARTGISSCVPSARVAWERSFSRAGSRPADVASGVTLGHSIPLSRRNATQNLPLGKIRWRAARFCAMLLMGTDSMDRLVWEIASAGGDRVGDFITRILPVEALVPEAYARW